jgi:hypothetical protein
VRIGVRHDRPIDIAGEFVEVNPDRQAVIHCSVVATRLIANPLQCVGWAKAHLRRAHHFFESNVSRRVVGTPPNAFAPGRFAHPTRYFVG